MESNKGKKTILLWQNPDYRERMRLAHTGKVGFWKNKKRPIETIEKIRKSLTGYKHDEEFCKKVSENLTGRKHSIESRIKMSLKRRGSNSSNWKGGVSKTNELIRKGIDFRIWRESVFSRDDWTCQECKLRGGELHAHHIKPFAYFPELRFDVSNGLTLCKDCHMKTDSYCKQIKLIRP